jgi:hypothetical protein
LGDIKAKHYKKTLEFIGNFEQARFKARFKLIDRTVGAATRKLLSPYLTDADLGHTSNFRSLLQSERY